MAQVAEADSQLATRRVTARRVGLTVGLVGLFGLATGVHVLGLLAGRAIFQTTRLIEGLVPGVALDSCPAPAWLGDFPARLQALSQIGRQPWLVALTCFSGAAAAFLMVRLMNPNLLGGLRSRKIRWWRPAIAILVTVGAITAALWPLPEHVARTAFPLYRAGLAGALVWLLWHRSGWIHTDDDLPGLFRLLGQLLCGAVVGLVAHFVLRHVPRAADYRVLDRWLGAGLWSPAMWREVALYSLAVRAWGGLVVGSLAAFLAVARVPLRERCRLVAAPVMVAFGLLGAGWLWRQVVWVGQWRYDRPLVADVGPAEPPAPVEEDLYLLDDGPGPLPRRRARGLTVVGLPIEPATVVACREYLERHQARACGSRSAWIHLHDTALWDWRPLEAVAEQQRQLTSAGADPVFVAVLLEALLRLPAEPAAEAAVTALLDPARFSLPPAAAGPVALVAWRWGRLDEALTRFEPEPEIATRLRAEPPPRRDGVIEGRLTRDGRPWAGARLAACRMAELVLLAGPPQAPVTPYALRVAAAATVTDEAGRFRFENLFTDAYALLLRLPAQTYPEERPAVASGAPGVIVLDRDRPRREIGPIDLRAGVR